MGQATHKKQYSTLCATTSLDPDGVAHIAKQVGESIKNPLPGGAFVRFEGAEPGRLHFAIRGGGYTWGNREVMTFVVNIARNVAGRTAVNTQIEDFCTSQTTYFFIPVAPKELQGYRTYKKFAEQFASALAQYDPQTQATLVDRPQTPVPKSPEAHTPVADVPANVGGAPTAAPPLWSALVVDALTLLMLLVLVTQNAATVTTSFLFLRSALAVGVVVLLSILWGGVIGGITMALIRSNTRASAGAVKSRPARRSVVVVVGALILLVLLVLVVQNTHPVMVQLLFFHVVLSLGVVILLSIVTGGLIGGLTLAAVRGSSNANARAFGRPNT